MHADISHNCERLTWWWCNISVRLTEEMCLAQGRTSMQAVKTQPRLFLLSTSFCSPLFRDPKDTFPRLPPCLHSVTQALPGSPVTGSLCEHGRRKAERWKCDTPLRRGSLCSETHSARQWRARLQTASVQPEKDAQENKALLRDV